MVVDYIKKHKSVLWFSVLPVMALIFYLLKLIIPSYHAVHIPLDDKIPFVPAFVIPYIMWFLYIPLMMLFIYLADEKLFGRRMFAFTVGIGIAIICFIVYPTVVTFRPSADGNGVFLWILRIVYAFDNPSSNDFPSLHCYQAVMLHLLAFVNGPYKDKKLIRTCSAILVALICAATVLIKQHSAIDLFAGVGMAFVIFAVFCITKKGDKI